MKGNEYCDGCEECGTRVVFYPNPPGPGARARDPKSGKTNYTTRVSSIGNEEE